MVKIENELGGKMMTIFSGLTLICWSYQTLVT